MSAIRSIAKLGVVGLVFGRAGEMQYHVSLDVGFRNARSGRAVAIVASDTHLTDNLICWRHGVGVQQGERLKCEIVLDGKDLHRAADRIPAAERKRGISDFRIAIDQELFKRKFSPQVIVLTEPSLDPVGIDGYGFPRYLDAARYFAAKGVAVVMPVHTASVARKVEIKDVELWHCASQNGSTATVKGPAGEVVQLKSRYHGDTLLGYRTTLILEEMEPVT